jgi:hypothetical protein
MNEDTPSPMINLRRPTSRRYSPNEVVPSAACSQLSMAHMLPPETRSIMERIKVDYVDKWILMLGTKEYIQKATSVLPGSGNNAFYRIRIQR